jgi:hypothetical protein
MQRSKQVQLKQTLASFVLTNLKLFQKKVPRV